MRVTERILRLGLLLPLEVPSLWVLLVLGTVVVPPAVIPASSHSAVTRRHNPRPRDGQAFPFFNQVMLSTLVAGFGLDIAKPVSVKSAPRDDDRVLPHCIFGLSSLCLLS